MLTISDRDKGHNKRHKINAKLIIYFSNDPRDEKIHSLVGIIHELVGQCTQGATISDMMHKKAKLLHRER